MSKNRILPFTTLLLLLLPIRSQAFYSNSTHVVELDSGTFSERVLSTPNIWIVQFYVKQSQQCQKFVLEYEKAARALKDFVNVGAVNVGKSPDLIQKYSLAEYPTVKVFNDEPGNVFDYSFGDDYTAQGVVLDGFKAIRKRVEGGLKSRLADLSAGIVELHDETFEKLVLNSEDVWLVIFYDDQSLDGADLNGLVEGLTMELKSLKVGAVSAENLYTRSIFNAHELPTVVFLPFGIHTKKLPVYFDGDKALTKELLTFFVQDQYAKMPVIKPTGIAEILDEEAFEESCKQASLCIVVFLPELKTFSHLKRENYYAMFKEQLGLHKFADWMWAWCEYGRIPNLEVVLGVDEINEPTVSAVEVRHVSHLLLKGPFTLKELAEFLENARIGAVQEEHVFVDDIFSDSYAKDEL